MKVVAWLVVFGMVLVAFSPFMTTAHGVLFRNDFSASEPINIDGNSALSTLATQNGWPGNGTPENPYIISGYVINATGNSYAFSISNTDLCFILENSALKGAQYGVILKNVKNAVIMGNNVSGNSVAGLWIDSSSNISVYSNVMYGTGIQISGDLQSLESLKIASNNTVNGKPVYYYKDAYDISISVDAGEIIIVNSTQISCDSLAISHTTFGLGIYYSSEIGVYNSTFTYMSTDGVYVAGSNNVTIYAVQSGLNNASGIFVTGSENVNISSITSAYNAKSGIYLDHTVNSRLSNDVAYNNYVGVELYYSSQNVIVGGDFYNNTNSGVELAYSSNNEVSEITTWGNVNGIFVNSAHYNTFYGNTMKDDGMDMTGDKTTFISQEIPDNNTVNGKSLLYYANKNFNWASVGSGAGEIILAEVSSARVEGLTFSGQSNALIIAYSQNIYVVNTSFSNVKTGVYVLNSRSISVQGNSFTSFSYSVYFEGVNYSVVSDNVMFNGSYGVYLTKSSYDLINNNTESHMGVGVDLMYFSSWNVVERNNISYCVPSAMFLVAAYNNIIRGNVFTYSKMDAIWIMEGSDNVLYNNTFKFNNNSGTTYNASHIQAEDDDGGNLWNITGYGNYWYDWANNNDTNYNVTTGIIKWPYVIYGGSAGYSLAKDYLPLKYPSSAKVFVPSAPTELTAHAGTGYVYISWNSPIDDGGSPVTSYRIYRNGVVIATVPAYQHDFNDTGVEGGQTYTYYVIAVNSVGGLFKSNTVQATPGGEVPEFSSYAAVLVILSFVSVVVLRRRHH
ncbi:MAG: hypothetical protein GXO25_04780 [Euryarchaeota archaeon]|nr:hypothetical protein [Euryarchaeota archaeon]